MSTETSGATFRSRVCHGLVGATLALGLAIGSSAVANAKPIAENDIKTECKAAGGTYGTKAPTRKGGSRISTCTLKDGEKDTYVDGYWVTTGPA